MTIEQQRAEFEDWYAKYWIDKDDTSTEIGSLFYLAMRASWQAAIASVSAQPVELTGEEIIKIYDTHVNSRSYIFIDQARAVLAAHKSKNKPGLKVENV